MNYREKKQAWEVVATILFVVSCVCGLLAIWNEAWQWGATGALFFSAAFIAFLCTQ